MRISVMAMGTATNTATTAKPRVRAATGRQRMVARVAIVVGLLTAGALLLPNSLAVALGDDHPALAARIAPNNARIATALAAAIGGDPRKPQIRQLVRIALARDLTDLPGLELRAADLTLSNHRGEAQRLFEHCLQWFACPVEQALHR